MQVPQFQAKAFNYKRAFYIAIGVVVAILILYFKNGDGDFDLQQQNTYFKSTIDKNGREIVEQRQQILSLKVALKNNLLEKEKYMKSIASQTKVGTITKIEKVFVPYEVEKKIFVDTNTFDTTYYVKTPIPVSWKDSWNFFGGVVKHDGFYIDSFGSENKMRITIGEKKRGMFRKAEPIVEIKNENPKTRVTAMTNITIKQKPPFYQRWWFVGSVALIVGKLFL
jgi:cell division protein FtsL